MAGQVVILVIGGRWVLDGTMEIGQLVAFILYLTAFFAPIQQLVQLYNTYQQGQASVRKLRDLLGEVPSVVDRPGAPDLPELAGEVRLEDVAFEYVPGRPVLRDVDLVIPAGETLRLRRGDRRRQVHHRQARQPPLRPRPRAGCSSTASTCATSRCARCGSRWARCRRSRSCSPARSATTSPSPGPTRPRPRCSRPAASSGSATSSTGCPTGSTRRARAGRVAVVRRAPAPRAGPRVPRPPADPRARRGHLEPRPEVRGQDRARPRRAARGPHRDPHRPPPRHRHARRPHRGRPRRPRSSSSAPTTSSSTAAAATPRWSRPGTATRPRSQRLCTNMRRMATFSLHRRRSSGRAAR